MKTILLTLITVLSFTTFANSDIAAIAKQLGAVAESGVSEYALEGGTLEELVKSLRFQITEEENTAAEYFLNYKNVQTSDEYIWGTTDAQNFSDILFSAVHFMDDDASENKVLYSKKEISTIIELLKDLKSADVIYSWNPHGDSVCGEMLTTPILIDSKTKKAYEFNFYKIEGC
jgi:hypothetical protein